MALWIAQEQWQVNLKFWRFTLIYTKNPSKDDWFSFSYTWKSEINFWHLIFLFTQFIQLTAIVVITSVVVQENTQSILVKPSFDLNAYK